MAGKKYRIEQLIRQNGSYYIVAEDTDGYSCSLSVYADNGGTISIPNQNIEIIGCDDDFFVDYLDAEPKMKIGKEAHDALMNRLQAMITSDVPFKYSKDISAFLRNWNRGKKK